jgi:hypothetical protein
LSRRIDVVGCGNVVRKEGRKEGRKEREKELMWVATMQEARRRRSTGWSGGASHT